MSEAANTDGGESGLQILNNLGYLLGVPFLLILAVILLAWWQYRRRKQRIAAITGTGATSSSSTSISTSISSKIWSWRHFMMFAMTVLVIWWQWDWVVGLWQSDDWLGQLWNVVLAIHALEPADVVPVALIAFLALAVIGVLFIIKSGDTDAMKDVLPWVALIICVMILFFAFR